MANAMGRKVVWGFDVVQLDDGTWAGDWSIDIHDHEVMPENIGEVRVHLRNLVERNPAAKALADAAEIGRPDAHSRCDAIARALVDSADSGVRGLVSSRDLKDVSDRKPR